MKSSLPETDRHVESDTHWDALIDRGTYARFSRIKFGTSYLTSKKQIINR
ncbi:hypothetical protein [Algoriphagus marincola]|nr:hypothetical protein [Algoriphagus marincola]